VAIIKLFLTTCFTSACSYLKQNNEISFENLLMITGCNSTQFTGPSNSIIHVHSVDQV